MENMGVGGVNLLFREPFPFNPGLLLTLQPPAPPLS